VAVETQDAIVLTVAAEQGPAGPPGEGTSAEPALHIDYSDGRYWYVGYATRIKRLDQSVSPAAVGFAAGAWADRAGLTYG
jgi:hypothetical protein